MGNCSCLERRARVTAWDDAGDDDDWGRLPAAEISGGRAAPALGVVSAENGGGMRVKIRMTKGQLRRLLEMSAGRGGAPDEDVVAEIMSMGTVTVRVDVEEFRHADAAERHNRPPMLKLETIQEDDLDE